jgi:hypothetical protein
MPSNTWTKDTGNLRGPKICRSKLKPIGPPAPPPPPGNPLIPVACGSQTMMYTYYDVIISGVTSNNCVDGSCEFRMNQTVKIGYQGLCQWQSPTYIGPCGGPPGVSFDRLFLRSGPPNKWVLGKNMDPAGHIIAYELPDAVFNPTGSNTFVHIPPDDMPSTLRCNWPSSIIVKPST